MKSETTQNWENLSEQEKTKTEYFIQNILNNTCYRDGDFFENTPGLTDEQEYRFIQLAKYQMSPALKYYLYVQMMDSSWGTDQFRDTQFQTLTLSNAHAAILGYLFQNIDNFLSKI